MLKQILRCAFGVALLISASNISAQSNVSKALFDRVSPSLVAVQWTWAYEWGRAEYVGGGVVVRDDGLIAIPMQVADPGIPDSQMVDFKIIVPSKNGAGADGRDEQEIDAVFVGRDERADLAYVKPKDSSKRKWQPIKFEDVDAQVGEPVTSLAMLTKSAGYQPYITHGIVGTHFRGEMHHVAVTSGELAGVGGVVFNETGQAIGYVNTQSTGFHLLFTTGSDSEIFQSPLSALLPIEVQPAVFVPAADILISINHPPTIDHPLEYPWIGAALTGMEKDVAEEFGLQDRPAMEITDVVPAGPFDKAGLKVGMKIVKINAAALERGDLPEELPQIVTRKIQRMKTGDVITVSVLSEKGKPLTDYKVTLEKRPARQNEMSRFWAEDIGMSVRDLTFHDLYTRKQPTDLKGVMVALVKGDGAAASAKMVNEMIITTLNGTAIKDLTSFKAEYGKLRANKPKEAIVLVVLNQDGQTQTMRIEPPQ